MSMLTSVHRVCTLVTQTPLAQIMPDPTHVLATLATPEPDFHALMRMSAPFSPTHVMPMLHVPILSDHLTAAAVPDILETE